MSDATKVFKARHAMGGKVRGTALVANDGFSARYDLDRIADLCDGRRFVKPLLAVTSPQVKPDCDRFGYTERIEGAGGQVLSGMCFYQSYAREVAEANGWKRLATNSAKLVNILGGYGYVPMLASMEQCVEAAETGRLA